MRLTELRWSGQAVGHWMKMGVLHSVTRAAALISPRLRESNWIVRQIERLGMAVFSPHISQ